MDPARAGALQAIDATVRELAAAIGGSLRIRATGLPHSYDGFITFVVFVYFLFAPVY